MCIDFWKKPKPTLVGIYLEPDAQKVEFHHRTNIVQLIAIVILFYNIIRSFQAQSKGILDDVGVIFFSYETLFSA